MAQADTTTAEQSLLRQLFGPMGYASFGFLGVVSNALIVLSIVRYQALRRRKELILLGALSFADFLNMTAFWLGGSHRVYLILSGKSTLLYTRSQCLSLPHAFLWQFTEPLAPLMLSVISTDRLLLVSLRERYLNSFGRCYAWSMVLVSYGVTIGFALLNSGSVLLNSIEEEPSLSPFCYASLVYASGDPTPLNLVFNVWYRNSLALFGLASVIVFALVLPVHRRNRNKVAPTSARTSLKQQHKLTKSLALSCVCTLFLFVLPWRLGVVLRGMGWQLLGYMVYFLTLINCFINIFIYSVRQREMRDALVHLVKCQELPGNMDLWPHKQQAVARLVASNLNARRSVRDNDVSRSHMICCNLILTIVVLVVAASKDGGKN